MPPITPEQLAEASTRLDKLTQQLEKTILDDICRRIAKAGTITDTAEWQMIRLKELGYANEVIEKAVADYTGMSEAEIRQLFFEAGQVSDDFYEEVYSKAGMPFVPLEENAYVQQQLNAGIAQTQNKLVNFTQSMGFAVRQFDGSIGFQPVAKTYQNALDLAQMQVATGVFDYTTAIRNALKTLTDNGLQFVDYESGHRNRADVAARRAVLTGVSQLTGKVSEQNMQELETDIVEVTAHAGARPDHAEWQGKWYSFSGTSSEYPSLVEVTGYGTGAGLKGWNCRHDFYPVIPGISEPAYTDEELANIDPPPIEYNGKTLTYYECTQKQRAMETAMRKTKREIIAAEASGDEDMLTAKSILLRRQKEEYAKFSKAAKLYTQNERTQVYGFGKSVAQKARWKAQKALDNGGGSDIINTNKKYNFVAHSKHINDFGKYPTYTNEEIRTELFKSTVGRRAVEYINDNSIYVEFDYTPIPPIGEKGWCFGGIIHVYMGNCNNIKDIAKVIIHETTHSWIDSYQNSLREEFYCRIQEYYHTQNTLSLGELLKIARDVQENYKHQGMKWREPNGYKRRGYDKEN